MPLMFANLNHSLGQYPGWTRKLLEMEAQDSSRSQPGRWSMNAGALSTPCVASARLSHLLVPQFPHPQNGVLSESIGHLVDAQ